MIVNIIKLLLPLLLFILLCSLIGWIYQQFIPNPVLSFIAGFTSMMALKVRIIIDE